MALRFPRKQYRQGTTDNAGIWRIFRPCHQTHKLEVYCASGSISEYSYFRSRGNLQLAGRGRVRHGRRLCCPSLYGTNSPWLQIFEEIADGLTSFMKTKGYESIQDFRGIALKHLSSAEQLAELKPQHAVVDQYLCNGCGMCVRACLFGAMDMAGKKAASNPDRCDGCGLCVELCALEAINLVE